VGVIGGAAAVAVAGFALLAGLPGGPLLVALPFVVMVAVSVPFGAVYNVAASTTAVEGTALATVVAVGNLVALVLPVVTGAIRDATGGYAGAFALLVGLNAVALAAALLLRRRARRERPAGGGRPGRQDSTGDDG
jgi:nitrate/nitrite transporter NarK